MKPKFEMNPLYENLTLEQMLVAQHRDRTELQRLADEREYLEERLKLNTANVDFINAMIGRRDGKIANLNRVAHRASCWSAGYYSHDAD